MDIWQRIEELPSLLHSLGKKEDAAIVELDSLLYAVFGEHLDRHCSYCINKAYQKLTRLTQEKLTEMSKSKYKLKDDQVVYFSHAHYTNANLTNEIAEEIVASNPANVELFDVAPEVKEKKDKEPKYTDEQIASAYKKGEDVFVTVGEKDKKVAKGDLELFDVANLPVRD